MADADRPDADPTTIPESLQYWLINLVANNKNFWDQLSQHAVRDDNDKARYQDQMLQFAARVAEQNQTLVMQMAQNGAALANLVNNNAAAISQQSAQNSQIVSNRGAQFATTVDNMVAADAMTSNQAAQAADNRMMTELADSVQNEVKQALETALGAGVGNSIITAPPAAGTSGVSAGLGQLGATTAQGFNQQAAGVVSTALMTDLVATNQAIVNQLVKLSEVVGAVLAKVSTEVTE